MVITAPGIKNHIAIADNSNDQHKICLQTPGNLRTSPFKSQECPIACHVNSASLNADHAKRFRATANWARGELQVQHFAPLLIIRSDRKGTATISTGPAYNHCAKVPSTGRTD